MAPLLRCMGVSLFVTATTIIAHAHPNASDAGWQLEYGVPLQSGSAPSTRRTTKFFLSALSNAPPFLRFSAVLCRLDAGGHIVWLPRSSNARVCPNLHPSVAVRH